ncbi:MAG TPA: 7-cyano-7-deazaguanine synthase [Chloroflexia bacterium]|jgi:7-cyano-7-deazaguanine synthase
MNIVTLVSGGVDSSLIAIWAKEEGFRQFPLFIDYGQICKEQEWKACIDIHERLGLPTPVCMNLQGFGYTIASGLTSPDLRVNEDAFLPGRNLLFLLAGAAYAYQVGAQGVTIGLLSEDSHLFPDQTTKFVRAAEDLLELSMGRKVKILTPLMKFNKADVLNLADGKGLVGTYSCHAGTATPCGECVSCVEAKRSL